MDEKILYCDIETYSPTGHPDSNIDELRYVGFRFPNGDKKIFHFMNQEAIQNIISSYNYIAGHNIEGYDMAVMQRYGYRFVNRSNVRLIPIDTYKIIDKRAKSMMYLDLNDGERSLKSLAERFGLSTKKSYFDYSKLKAISLVGKDYQELVQYLNDDLDSGYELLEYLYDFFYAFKEMMDDKNKRELKWLTSSSGSTAYKIICNMANLPEIYNSDATTKNKAYDGAFVSMPYSDCVEGNIYCIDFNSLYPHMFMGGNLYTIGNDWKGGGLYGNGEDHIKGVYSKEQGPIEKVLQKLFNERNNIKKQMKSLDKNSSEYRTLDKKQLSRKIVINTMYGISGSPLFTSVYNLTTASDCTAMARTSIKQAREYLAMNGYECIYTDTDSVYVLDVFNDIDKLKRVCKEISDYQRSNMNVPIETHNFEIENPNNPIRKMFFFRSSDNKFVKKHYLKVYSDGKVDITGLKPVRGDCSPIAKEIFHKQLSGLFLAKNHPYFDPSELKQMIIDIGQTNPSLLTKRYRVYSLDGYANTTSIQAQISAKYGPGEHFLILNKFIGAGKSKKYATLEDLKTSFGDKWMTTVDYDHFLKDLSEFIKPSLR